MVLPTTTNAANVMQLPTVNGMQVIRCDMECDTVCATRHVMNSAMCNEGAAFFAFFVSMLSRHRRTDGMLGWLPGRHLGRVGPVVNT